MKALKLSLTDFRNYEKQEIKFGDGVNIIFGDNAQGKTNILEAVYFFAMGKSNRARRDAELIRHGSQRAEISLEFKDSLKTNLLTAEIYRDKEICKARIRQRGRFTAREVVSRRFQTFVFLQCLL